MQLQSAVSAYQADQTLVLQVAQVSDQNTKITLLADLVGETVVAIESVIPPARALRRPSRFAARRLIA